jgi:glucose-1-phosphate cytidylyltransferase
MVEIAGKPMLWHLMNLFAIQGFDDFVIATGYLSKVIDTWVDALDESWKVRTQFTGIDTQTGGRIQKCILATEGDRFFATYGDGLANVDLAHIVSFHERQGLAATLTSVRPPARFGVVESQNGIVTHFGEKVQSDSGWINGGFFVLERRVADFVYGDQEPFETGALPRLVTERQLGCFQHEGFWKPMDTLREKQELEEILRNESAPWLKGIDPLN